MEKGERGEQFVADISIAGSFSALTLRSPLARGRLKGIECPPLPAPYTLITAKDIPGVNSIDGFPVPILAGDELSYIGEPVALLIGPDEVKLGDYCSQCRVLAEEDEPPIFSEGALLAERIISIGEMPEPDKVKTRVSGTYKTGIQEHWYAEPHTALASFSDTMTVYTATQWVFYVQRSVSQCLSLPPERVVIVPTKLGVHLDGKLWYPALVACHAALGAFITGKPVRLSLTREEDFRYSPKRNATEIHITSSLGEDGELLGTEIKLLADLGAAPVFTDEILDQTCLGSFGVYRASNVRLKAEAIKTNIPPQGPFAGFGLSQGFFAMERQASRIADALRVEPSEWRKQHALRKNDSLAIGAPLKDAVYLEQVLDSVSAMGDYKRKWASYELLRRRRRESAFKEKETPLRGIGIAGAYQGSGFLYAGKTAWSVEATLETGGFLEIRTSAVPANDAFVPIVQHLAAKVLAIEPDKVRLNTESTAPDSGPSSSSRNIAVITQLIERCCMAIKKQRPHAPFPLTVRRVYKPSRAQSWGDQKTFDPNVFSRISFGAAVVEVEIACGSLIPNIRGLWLCIDGGKILFLERAQNAVKTSAIHALGWASREHLFYTDGKIAEKLVYRYDISSPADAPFMNVSFLETGAPAPKGIGELPFSTLPAAYIQAVSQALDYPFERIPISAEDLWKASLALRTPPR